MKIVVLCGGLSSEREVSLTSGSHVANSLRSRGHEVLLLDMYLGYEGQLSSADKLFTTEIEDTFATVKAKVPDIMQSGGVRLGKNVLEICRCADIIFLALHGEDGEDGKIQATFDLNGIKYTGSGYLGSAIAMNKSLSKLIFEANDIPTPSSITLQKSSPRQCPPWYPCVVKPCSGGSSVGTSIVRSDEEYFKALKLAFEYEETVLVEKFISGRELTVGLLDGKAMPSIEIVTKNGWYDYKNKYQPNSIDEICPAPLSQKDSERLTQLAEKIYTVLFQEVYSRVDFILDNTDGEIYCLEANSLPGMTPMSLIPQMAKAMGLHFGELCEKIIQLSMEKYIR